MLRVGSVFPGMPRGVAGVTKVLRSLVQSDSRTASIVTMTFGGSPDGSNEADVLRVIDWEKPQRYWIEHRLNLLLSRERLASPSRPKIPASAEKAT